MLEEQVTLPRQRLFGRQSEQTVDLVTPQMALFNEAEYEVELAAESAEEEVAAPFKACSKRKPLPADLPCSRSRPRTSRVRADLCLRVPQACDR